MVRKNKGKLIITLLLLIILAGAIVGLGFADLRPDAEISHQELEQSIIN